VPRQLDPSSALPPVSWLFKHPKAFRESPPKYIKRCGWCSKTFWILNMGFRACPTCDLGEET